MDLDGTAMVSGHEKTSLDAVVLGCLQHLRTVRPVFHSEADFQHALAWVIHRTTPETSIRLEVPRHANDLRMTVDIVCFRFNRTHYIELKYKTLTLATCWAGEMFEVRGHGAQDLGRYDFLKDIHRLESLVSHNPNATGQGILLTNDGTYWRAPRDPGVGYGQFSLEQGRRLHGNLGWGERAGPGTRKGRESPIQLGGSYALDWQDYSTVPGGRNNRFRTLVVTVPNDTVTDADSQGHDETG